MGLYGSPLNCSSSNPPKLHRSITSASAESRDQKVIGGEMDMTEKKELETTPSAGGGGGSTEYEQEGNESERYARELKAGLHPLRNKLVFWYSTRTPGVSYEENIKKLVEFSTVEGFWVCYCHITRPATLPPPMDLSLFKEGIQPLWEDPANSNGGKWIIRFRKVISGRFWEDLVLAFVGDQFDFGEDVCGIVLTVRYNEDILCVWNRNSSDQQVIMALKDSIKRHLKLPNSYMMEYKPHGASIRDNSSYRNAWIRG